jgi:multiple sugar transport system substrate-binding protein
MRTTRRDLLLGGLGAAMVPALPLRAQAPVRIRMGWWGSQERADRTNKVNQLYVATHPGVTVDGESMGWSDYWPKLATQVVGRNAPDLIQMDYRYLFEYGRRNALLPLDKYVPNLLRVGDWDAKFLDVGKADGKLYGINFGANSPAMVFSRSRLQELGIAMPTPEMTWAEMGRMGEEITKKVNRPDYYGLCDSCMREPIFEIFLRQKGKLLFTADDKLGFDTADTEEWLAMWQEMRDRKACVPIEIQATYQNSIESSALSMGKAAVDFPHSNQLVAYQNMNREKLDLTMLPVTGKDAKPGQYLKPSQLLSVFARSRQPEEAVKLLDFFVNDAKAGEFLGVERGAPISEAQRAVVKSGTDETSRQMVAYIELVSERVGPVPPPPPKGAGEITLLLRRVSEQVGFKRLKAPQAAQQFMAEAADILSRG